MVHGFPPLERTGVETHVAALARALARRGVEVEVFAPRTDPTQPEFALRREERDGYGLTWVIANRTPRSAAEHQDPPGMAQVFGEFLDRERPDLVHFHHAMKLGIGIFHAARRRSIPSVYTVHDYYPICHRVILARPDLTRCSNVGDSKACARCDRALSFLNQVQPWSDYQGGLLPEGMNQRQREALERILGGHATEEAASAQDAERAKLDLARKTAFDSIDLLLAPTHFVRGQLSAGGFDPRRVELCEYGIDATTLAALEPLDRSRRPLTFGYLGGAHKHKGLHVLLEAFSRLGSTPGAAAGARLSIHADSTDLEYTNALRARAGLLGVTWHGAYTQTELPRIMEGIDVLVLPSIWWENAPFVIREAHAARRPVIASDLPALRESVEDGVDGMLVTPGDPEALKRAMQRLIQEPEWASRLAQGARAPRSLDALCDELLGRYGELLRRRGPALPAAIPASARDFSQRVLECEASSVARLAERASAGLERLARSLGVEPGPVHEPEVSSIAVERLQDARREIAWRMERELLLAAQNADLENSRGELTKELARVQLDGDRARAALDQARRTLDARENELQFAAKAQADAAKAQAAAAKAQTVAAKAQADAAEALELEQRAHSTARSALAAATGALQTALADREVLRATLSELSRVNETLAAEAVGAEGELRVLAEQAAVLKQHANWLEHEAAQLTRRFGGSSESLRDPQEFQAATALLDRVEAELQWRRREMHALCESGGRIIRALVARSALGRRMGAWERKP